MRDRSLALPLTTRTNVPDLGPVGITRVLPSIGSLCTTLIVVIFTFLGVDKWYSDRTAYWLGSRRDGTLKNTTCNYLGTIEWGRPQLRRQRTSTSVR